jgi:hypothetical protein
MAADVGDAEREKDRSVRLAFEQEAKALFNQALCVCFAACEELDIAAAAATQWKFGGA